MTKAQKLIARAIVMAQLSSDAGKHLYTLQLKHRCDYNRGVTRGYKNKTNWIAEAIRLIRSNPLCGFNYWVQEAPDQNGYSSVLVYFDINIDGVRRQLSFHNPMRGCRELSKYTNTGRRARWTREIGGSREAAAWLIEKFDL